MNKRRVVITGLGAVTALGESIDELFSSLCEGKSGVSCIESFDVSSFPVTIGGEVKNFDVTSYIDQRESKRMDRFTQLAVAASSNAVDDSGLVHLVWADARSGNDEIYYAPRKGASWGPYARLTKATREAVAASLMPFELYFMCAILYLIITFSLSMFVQYLEKRMATT